MTDHSMIERATVHSSTPAPQPALFTAADYQALHQIVFRGDYPGYRPEVVEAPNGDSAARDTGKRYSHVAVKYLTDAWQNANPTDALRLYFYLRDAHHQAVTVARALGVAREFMPSFEHGAVRVLEYPAGAGSAMHTDFDLFTLNLYRNIPNAGLGADEVHMGELGELTSLGGAFPHFVAPLGQPQHSIVYFAIPDHATVLPGGQTVGQWLAKRLARSRYESEGVK